ncbi:MAG: cellulase N-terminal Ig-like domain-containing protein, partial [Pedobacter sp.]
MFRFTIALLFCLISWLPLSLNAGENPKSWIRINQMGYLSSAVKVAVLGSKDSEKFKYFELVDAASSKVVLKKAAGKNFGAYGPFSQSFRLDFTEFKSAGTYYLQAGSVRSPEFKIGNDTYKGAA